MPGRSIVLKLLSAMAILFMLGVDFSGAGCNAMRESRSREPDPEPRRTIEEVVEAVTPQFTSMWGVVSVHAERSRGREVVVVSVERRTPELEAQLPAELAGFRIVIREIKRHARRR